MTNPCSLRTVARTLTLLGLFYFTYVPLSHYALSAAYQSENTLLLFTAALCLMTWRRAQKPLRGIAFALRRILSIPPRLYVGACALLFFLLTACLSQILFDGIPHVADTHAQYVHSKIIAGGHLFLPSHPLRHFFDFQGMVNDGTYYSVYAPGHVLMLALGQCAGAPWLVNPLLGSLTVIALYVLAWEVGGRTVATIAAALMLASPFMVFMSSEYMNNVTCELFITLFLFCYIRQHKTSDWRYAIAAGLCVGYAFITRPQSTLPFALPVAAHAIASFVSQPKSRLKTTYCMAASFGFFVACLLYYNAIMNGNPWVQSRTDPMKFLRPFMGGSDWDSLLTDGIQRLRFTVSRLHRHLFGWPCSSLIFVLLLFLGRMQSRYCGLLIACCLGQLASQIVNPFTSMIFGPRYLYETSTSLILLTALCLTRLPPFLRKRLHMRVPLASAQASAALLVACLFILAFPAPIAKLYERYKNNYHEGNAVFYHTLMQTVQPPALVFFSDYAEFRWVYFTLPPTDDNPVIVALDRKDRQKLIDYYPGRSVYKVEHSVITKIDE